MLCMFLLLFRRSVSEVDLRQMFTVLVNTDTLVLRTIEIQAGYEAGKTKN